MTLNNQSNDGALEAKIYQIIMQAMYDSQPEIPMTVVPSAYTQKVMKILQDEILKARLQTIDEIFELSPKVSFQNWKPTDAFHFYERLRDYEKRLQSQLTKSSEGEGNV